MNAANRPGSLYFSAAAVPFSTSTSPTRHLLEWVIARADDPSSCRRLCALSALLHQFVLHLPPLVFDNSGLDSAIAGARPRFSAWSDTTRKSSGRCMRAGTPVLEVTALASGKPVRFLRPERIANHAGVGRIARVQMGTPKNTLLGNPAPDRGNIWTCRSAVVAAKPAPAVWRLERQHRWRRL